MPQPRSSEIAAVSALVGACGFWGLGFPIMKALNMGAQLSDPGISSWFVAAYLVGGRFFLATLLVLTMRRTPPNRSELTQGVALGLVTGVGMLLQTDGLLYTDASTSAFLTQGYVVLLPVASTLITRRAPPVRIVLCALLVSSGLAVLARFDPRTLALGRGETETLGAAACFTFQILLLDARRFAHNRVAPVTNVMFAVIVLTLLPVLALASRGLHDFAVPFAMPFSVSYFAIMVLLPTVGSFLLMNRYQRHVSASEAGIVYATEPVFASAFALVLPGLLSSLSGIHYPDETLHLRLVVGGALVVSANVLLALLQSGGRTA